MASVEAESSAEAEAAAGTAQAPPPVAAGGDADGVTAKADEQLQQAEILQPGADGLEDDPLMLAQHRQSEELCPV